MTNTKTHKKSLVPQLRFKEFDGEWEEFVLGEIATFSKGKNISKADISENGVTECIRYGELYTDYKEIINEIKSNTNLPFSSLILSEENDVLIPASGETQIDIATASCVKKAGVALGGDLNIIKTKKDGIYLSYYLNSEKKFDIARLAQGNSVVHVYNSQLKTLKLNFPSQLEQQKIATFLTAVDKKISQLTSKKEQLTQYKKGVMQQLFSQELRFQPDGSTTSLRGTQQQSNLPDENSPSASNENQFPDWEEKRLGEVCEIIGGGTPDTTIKEYWDGDIQWFTPTEVDKRLIGKSKRTISKLGLKKSSARLLPKGTLLFTSRATIGELSYAIEDCTTNQGFQSLVINSDNYSHFFYYWIKKNTKEFVRKSQGSTFLEISKNEMKKIKLIVPSLKEQQKIASYLSTLDDKIEAVQVQIEQTQEFKKGLLQQLFV